MHLEFDHIYRRFADKSRFYPVLEGLSFQAQGGQITGLVGPNGCGKTTSFHLLMGYLVPDAGHIALVGDTQAHLGSGVLESVLETGNGVDHAIAGSAAPLAVAPVTKWDPLQPKLTRQNCALLPEHPLLPKYLSGRDVMLEYGLAEGLPLKEIENRLEEFERSFPVKHFWNKPSLRYSRGQAGLISLGRVWMIAPYRPIVLLDEPTIGLDFDVTKMVHNWMKQLAQEGKIVIVATHILSDLQNVAHALVGIRNGQAVSHAEVLHWLDPSKKLGDTP